MKKIKSSIILGLLLSANYASAIHMYAGESCKGVNLELNYDGPGSNYAVGGYSHFYKTVNGKTFKVLALDESFNLSDESESQELLAKNGPYVLENENFEEENLGVLVKNIKSKVLKVDSKKSTKVGDLCEAGEWDYVHSESIAINSFKVTKIEESEVSKLLGLKKGDIIKMKCVETSDVPRKCPKNGKWDKSSIED